MKFDFFEGGGGGGFPYHKFISQLLLVSTLSFKFHQNRAINEEFYFCGGKIHPGGPKGGRVARIQKNLIQNDGFNPQPKFQHSS